MGDGIRRSPGRRDTTNVSVFSGESEFFFFFFCSGGTSFGSINNSRWTVYPIRSGSKKEIPVGVKLVSTIG